MNLGNISTMLFLSWEVRKSTNMAMLGWTISHVIEMVTFSPVLYFSRNLFFHLRSRWARIQWSIHDFQAKLSSFSVSSLTFDYTALQFNFVQHQFSCRWVKFYWQLPTYVHGPFFPLKHAGELCIFILKREDRKKPGPLQAITLAHLGE